MMLEFLRRRQTNVREEEDEEEDSNDPEQWLKRSCRQLARGRITELTAGHLTDESFVPFSTALRKNRSLKLLQFRGIVLSSQSALLLAPALKNATSLEMLEFQECSDEEGNIAKAVSIALLYNESLQILNIRGSWLQPSAAHTLGFLFASAVYLTEVHICHNVFDKETMRMVANGLAQNEALRTLDLTGNSLDDEAVAELCHGLSRLESLVLDFNAFGDEGVRSLSEMLWKNKMLRELHLFGNNVSAAGAQYLARALTVNRHLQSLILSFNRIGDAGAAALAQALTVNTTLTKIWFPANSVGTAGMQAFAMYLPHMKGLEQVHVGMLLDCTITSVLVSALEHNLQLSEFHMETPVSLLEEDEDDIANRRLQFYLKLNRTGRRLLQSEPSNMRALWPHVLAKAKGTPDILYYMLREKVDFLRCGSD